MKTNWYSLIVLAAFALPALGADETTPPAKQSEKTESEIKPFISSVVPYPSPASAPFLPTSDAASIAPVLPPSADASADVSPETPETPEVPETPKTPAPSKTSNVFVQDKGKIGLVDVNYILENWSYVKTRLGEMNQKFAFQKSDILARIKKYKRDSYNLFQLSPSSQDYRDQERTLFRERQAILCEQVIIKQDYSTRKAEIYLEAYRYIMSHARFWGAKRGLMCVIQFNRQSSDCLALPDDATPLQAVQKRINFSAILWPGDSVDLTGFLLDSLENRLEANGKLKNEKPEGKPIKEPPFQLGLFDELNWEEQPQEPKTYKRKVPREEFSIDGGGQF